MLDFKDLPAKEKIYYQDDAMRLYLGDCRHMTELEDGLIQMVCCSPPFWGLRKYAGKQEISEWGCAYGLEPTLELYVQHTIEILREVRRVLRRDGVVFWNIGDSYYNDTRGGIRPPSKSSIVKDKRYDATIKVARKLKVKARLLTTCPICLTDTYAEECCGVPLAYPLQVFSLQKPKDLCLIPSRLAIAAQEDGWWVRSVIIWSKPNPMPESVRDRPTESHEYILMLTKSAKYYYDQEAVKEKATRDWANTGGSFLNKTGWCSAAGRNDDNRQPGTQADTMARNIRSVWEFPTQPYPEAHFATFPEKLPEICIKAASKIGDLILDPFAGSGTTLAVAKREGRKAVGYEISEEYCKLARKRIEAVTAPMVELLIGGIGDARKTM